MEPCLCWNPPWILLLCPLRYLIYDIMAINTVPVVLEPFTSRYAKIEEEIVKPRTVERAYIQVIIRVVYVFV